MKIPVYNLEGKETDKLGLPKEVFDVKINFDLLNQVVLAQRGNRRQVSAHTKDRAEVSGGGKKPWRQKGTGRARAGSIRSPLWRGGGITFGPRNEKIYGRTIPSKMRKRAVLMVLSSKAKENSIFGVESLEIEKPKTKPMAKMLEKIMPEKSSGIILTLDKRDKAYKALRNLPKIKVMNAKDLNALDLLNHKFVILEKGAEGVIKDIFVK